MRYYLSLPALAVLAALSQGSIAADISVGKVLAFDRDAKRIVLTDRSVWSLAAIDRRIPDKLSAGDRIQFSHRSSDEGPDEIIEVNVMRERTAEDVRVSESGIVLAFDRAAQLLVLENKSAWSLENMQNSLPIGVTAGDRVRIEYGTDEDGTRRVHEVRIITY